MKLIKPSYQIITPINGEEILKQIELAARTCYQSDGKIEYTRDPNKWAVSSSADEYAKSARVLIPKLMNLNHEAMLEFGGMITVRFIVDRGVSHELVRHRVASFAQESTRYCNYGKDDHISFIIPCWTNLPEAVIDDNDDLVLWGNGEYKDYIPTQEEVSWLGLILHSELTYNWLITTAGHKWTPQQARSVLPNSLKTEINVSANIREWRHIFKLRTAKAAHPQMREVMQPLLDEFKVLIPLLFDDINYKPTTQDNETSKD